MNSGNLPGCGVLSQVVKLVVGLRAEGHARFALRAVVVHQVQNGPEADEDRSAAQHEHAPRTICDSRLATVPPA